MIDLSKLNKKREHEVKHTLFGKRKYMLNYKNDEWYLSTWKSVKHPSLDEERPVGNSSLRRYVLVEQEVQEDV